MPWIVLSLFVFVWGLPQMKTALNGLSAPRLAISGLDKLVERVPPVVAKSAAEPAVFTFNWLSATGTAILMAAIGLRVAHALSREGDAARVWANAPLEPDPDYTGVGSAACRDDGISLNAESARATRSGGARVASYATGPIRISTAPLGRRDSMATTVRPAPAHPLVVTDYGDAFPNSRKVHVEGLHDIRVPFREIALSGGEPPLRVYDTSGPRGCDVHEGLPILRYSTEWYNNSRDVRQPQGSVSGPLPTIRASSTRSRSQSMTAFAAPPSSRRSMWPGIVLGLGLGGFVDGIALHQIAQWHNMGSAVLPPTTMEAMKQNMVWDGLFHAAVWVVTLAGVFLLLRDARRGDALPDAGAFTGQLVLGWGFFNLVEGIIDHHVLQLHHVRDLPTHVPLYDWLFLAIGGAGFIALGWLMSRGAGSSARATPR